MTDFTKKLREEWARRMPEISVIWRLDRKGVASGWCRIFDGALLRPLGEAVAAVGGRLSMITAYLSEAGKRAGQREVAYHFDLDGDTLTVTVVLPLVGARLPSLTPLFHNADWNEREMMELYDLEVTGHPDPRPLFIDDSAGPQVFERLVAFSTFVSGSGSKALWDRVMATQAAKEKS